MIAQRRLARVYEGLPYCAASFICQKLRFFLEKRGVDSMSIAGSVVSLL